MACIQSSHLKCTGFWQWFSGNILNLAVSASPPICLTTSCLCRSAGICHVWLTTSGVGRTRSHTKVWMPCGLTPQVCRITAAGRICLKHSCFSWIVIYTRESEHAQPYQYLRQSNSCEQMWKTPNHKVTWLKDDATHKCPAVTCPPGENAAKANDSRFTIIVCVLFSFFFCIRRFQKVFLVTVLVENKSLCVAFCAQIFNNRPEANQERWDSWCFSQAATTQHNFKFKLVLIQQQYRYLQLNPNVDNLNSWTIWSPVEITFLSLMC